MYFIPESIREFMFSLFVNKREGIVKEALLSRAVKKTGLSDWGDLPFEASFEILIDALNREARLSRQGQFIACKLYLQLLCSLLRLVDDFKKYPEIEQVPVQSPVFVMGFPRTGTTFLHNLLALEPAGRSMKYWELMFPSPPPGLSNYESNWRIQKTKWFVRGIDWLAPSLKSIHSLKANGAEECCFIFDHLFLDDINHPLFEIPSYNQYYLQHDHVPSYRFHRKMLQLYGWKFSFDRFVLKAPRHVFCLDALLKVYPDAKIVWTHRDPCKAVSSFCSLMETSRRIISNDIDTRKTGQLCLEYVEKDYLASIQNRPKAPDRSIYDVSFRELTCDPLKTVQRIYEHFGFDYSDEFDRRIQRQLVAGPKRKRGVHHYTMERYGLSPGEIEERLSGYRETYGAFL